ncbi:MAG: LuxR family transcriptional regulator [Legionella sp.]|nr:MAG: LuxR family transcriptional regulator [Legionella sp.]
MQDTKICIIDDNPAVCESLRFLFESVDGSKVEIYMTAMAFLEKFSSEWIGCLIVDFFMPSLNGIELMKELKKRNNRMGVVMICGNGTPEIEACSLTAGAEAFMSKPFHIDKLLGIVKTITAKQNMLS